MSAAHSTHANDDDDDFQSITRIFNTGSLLHCPLCKKDIQDPRILCSNGHTFCHDCIKVSFFSPLSFVSNASIDCLACSTTGWSSQMSNLS